jgi:hypothetical protein
LPARVPYPGCEWPPHAVQPAFESAVGGGALATLASALCIRQQEDWHPSVQPCVLASTLRVCGCRRRGVNLQVACVPDGEEMLAGHLGGVQDAADVPPRVTDPSVPIATAVVRDARTALRFVALEPRLPLRLHPSAGTVVGIDTSLRQHAFFAAAEQDGVAVLEVPGDLAPVLQACLRLGVMVRRYVSLEQRPAVQAALRELVSALQLAFPMNLRLDPMPVTAGATPGGTALLAARLRALPLLQSGQWLVVGGWGRDDDWSEGDVLSLVGGLQQEL